tara:strand:- start:87 stop:1238 length:1152 start_codon:yes stop_codon:yes gene_type:complete
MKSIVIILAGGKGSRVSNAKHKQFIDINGYSILEHTLRKFNQVYKKSELIIAFPKSMINDKTLLFYKKYTSNKLVSGGLTRKKSVEKVLKYIDKMHKKPENILIHDSARPNTSISLIKNIKRQIHKRNVNFVVPYENIVSTLKFKNSNKFKTIDRSNYITTQTPQAFKYNVATKIFFNKHNVTDDAQLAEIHKISKGIYLKGESENLKITTKKDVDLFKKLIAKEIIFRVGNGFDVHRLVKGNGIMLGGIKIKSDRQLAGHSDGDVILHALCDSILGSLSKKDIGTHFPSSDVKFKGAASSIFLLEVLKFIRKSNYEISNIDITVICQSPSLKNYKEKIKKNLMKLTKLKSNQLNIKAKTTDYLGLIGKSQAISCWITTTVRN